MRSKRCCKETEEGGADDVGAEFWATDVFNMTQEELLPYYRRLYKKRANTALVFYHENNTVSCFCYCYIISWP
jgi:hypothetical protein